MAALFALLLLGKGAYETPFNARFALLNGYPLAMRRFGRQDSGGEAVAMVYRDGTAFSG